MTGMADEVHVTVHELCSRIGAALTRSGLSLEAARHITDSLCEAECCGKRTHGLIRVVNICAETARRRSGSTARETALSIWTEAVTRATIPGPSEYA
jgi:LDH2 family malate/lactate/ureidoglycolate dehydrogenase